MELFVWPHFNDKGDVCPICKTSKDLPCVLVPKPDTEHDGIVQAGQVHKKCYDFFMEMNSDDNESKAPSI